MTPKPMLNSTKMTMAAIIIANSAFSPGFMGDGGLAIGKHYGAWPGKDNDR